MLYQSVPPSQPTTHRARWVLGIGAVVLLGLACYGWLRSRPSADSPPEPTDSDPRLTFATPFRNVRPDVGYVGDDACASCHKTYCDTYRHHPMGQSLRPVGDLPQDTRPEGNPFKAMGLQFRVERRGKQVIHREEVLAPDGRVLAHTEAPVRYAIGSGAQAISYLIDHDGTLTESPITWYVESKSWDLSPGFKGAPDRFERPILADCLFCHCNRALPDPDTRSVYREPIFEGYSIGCERCHGPGALHVRARQNNENVEVAGVDTTIVNPARLEPALQEAVCAQCHLSGKERVLRRGREAFDFRPGMPLEAFARVFVLPPDLVQGSRVASHVEQLRASRCFQQSAGKFGCGSCHEAHSLPAREKKDAYYRDQCLKCHQPQSCTEPLERRRAKTPEDSCTVCHMPQQVTNIQHLPLTDHRIRRNPDRLQGPPVEPDPLTAIRSLRPFGQKEVDRNDRELLRDLAVASVGRARSQTPQVRKEVSGDFLQVLKEAVQAHPEDLAAQESLAVCLAWQGELGPALDVCDAVLARAPRRELALTDAGVIAQQMKLMNRSLDYWQRAVALNPTSARYHFALAQVYVSRNDWNEAAVECRRVLALNGAHPFARQLLMHYAL